MTRRELANQTHAETHDRGLSEGYRKGLADACAWLRGLDGLIDGEDAADLLEAGAAKGAADLYLLLEEELRN